MPQGDAAYLLPKDDKEIQKRKRGTGMSKMRWYAGRGSYSFSPMGHHFVRLEDGTQIEVHPDTYEQQFHVYLERIGVKPTTWSEILHKAEHEWKEYCRVTDAFAENHQQWFDYRGFGVFIQRPEG